MCGAVPVGAGLPANTPAQPHPLPQTPHKTPSHSLPQVQRRLRKPRYTCGSWLASEYGSPAPSAATHAQKATAIASPRYSAAYENAAVPVGAGLPANTPAQPHPLPPTPHKTPSHSLPQVQRRLRKRRCTCGSWLASEYGDPDTSATTDTQQNNQSLTTLKPPSRSMRHGFLTFKSTSPRPVF